MSIDIGTPNEGATDVGALRDLHDRCAAFLFEEAEYLDDRRFRDWLRCLSEDLVYEVPIRVTRGLDVDRDFSERGFHMKDTFASMKMRVERLYTEHGFAEDPPSRTTRLVTNIRVSRRSDAEVDVKSKFQCYRSQGDNTEYDLLLGERRDVLREADDGLKLARRTVRLAHTTLPTANLGVFL